MNRRKTLRFLALLGIKPIEQCDAELCDYCVWSSFTRNIGRRLGNNERHVHDDDIYIRQIDKAKILKFYEDEKRAAKAAQMPATSTVAVRSRDRIVLAVSVISFV